MISETKTDSVRSSEELLMALINLINVRRPSVWRADGVSVITAAGGNDAGDYVLHQDICLCA